MPSSSRSHLYLRAIGYGLYGTAGFVLWINATLTLLAFQNSGLPPEVAYGGTIFICLLETAVAVFLMSPQTWVELVQGFRAEADGTIGQLHGTARIAGAIVSAFLITALAALIVATYAIDWGSTFDGLNVASAESPYVPLIVPILVFGPEASSILAHQVLRRARMAAIEQHEEDSRLKPAEIYARELSRQRIKQAKQHAATAQQWNPNSNRP